MNAYGSGKLLVCVLSLAFMAVAAVHAQVAQRGGGNTMTFRFTGPAWGKSNDASDAQILKGVQGTDKKIPDVEYQLFSRYLAPSDDMIHASQWKVYYDLSWLNAGSGGDAADVAGGEDFAPADLQRKLLSLLEANMAKGAARYQAQMTQIPAFDQMLRKKRVTTIDTRLKPRRT